MSENSEVKRACVMGWPISHSLSPRLHEHWLKKYGINGSYTPMAIQPMHLKNALDLLKDRGYAGCNLTMPMKEMALPLMDEHDESCLFSGAINTVVITNGKLRGFNSDGFGFVESLRAQIPGWDGTRVVVIGTGGAARGIIVSLRAAGAKDFILVNRTKEKAEKIVKQFSLSAEIFPWEERASALRDATLLINCTSLGMTDEPGLNLDLSLLPQTAGVADIVYRPLITPLLTAAKKRGNPVAEGLPMLLHQGRLGFEHWFGQDPEVTTDLYNEIAEAA
jgi:shikimate dehydrogenase